MNFQTNDFIYDALRVVIAIICIVTVTYALCQPINIGVFK